jgi:hypothetical protein
MKLKKKWVAIGFVAGALAATTLAHAQSVKPSDKACADLQAGRPLTSLPADPEAFARSCGIPTEAELAKLQAVITDQQTQWGKMMQVRERIEQMKRSLAGK